MRLNADVVSVIATLLEGDVPSADGYWYDLDETCVPHYRGRQITPGEQAVLDEIERRVTP